MNDTPIAVFLKWFDACPEKIQMLISDFAVGHGPKLFPRQKGQLTTEAVRAALREANDTFTLESIGHLLFIITMTEYRFAGENSAAVLDRKRQQVEATREHLRQENREEALAHIINEELEKVTTEQKVWQQWDELRASTLSLEGIKKWMDALVTAASRQQMQKLGEAAELFQQAKPVMMELFGSLLGRDGKNEG